VTHQTQAHAGAEARQELRRLAELPDADEFWTRDWMHFRRAATPAVVLALLDALDAREWRDIETAPKMRKVLVSHVNGLGKRRCVLACYYKAHALEMDDDYADVGEYDEGSGISYAPEGWYEEHEHESPMMPLDTEPTHWQPLPLPPTPSPEDR
jgi:hypothetical protein